MPTAVLQGSCYSSTGARTQESPAIGISNPEVSMFAAGTFPLSICLLHPSPPSRVPSQSIFTALFLSSPARATAKAAQHPQRISNHSAASFEPARGPLFLQRLLKPLPFAIPHRCDRSLARSRDEPRATLDHHTVYATVLITPGLLERIRGH